MLIRETFATKIEERIEAVVKVVDRTPALVLQELTNLVVTPQWEKHLHRMLDEYTDAFEREDERKIGMWISGFFGSGKSLLMKVLGILLRGGEVAGQDVHQLFLQRLPANSRDLADIKRFLHICQSKITTALVGGNLHMRMATGNDPLVLIVFRLFAEERRYTQNWAFAWTIEYQIDNRGRTEQFRQRVSELSGEDWDEIIQDSDIYSEDLNQAAAEILPEFFSSADAVQKAVELAFQNGIAPQTLIERLRRWCESQDQGGRRQKVILQLDELGQWLQSGTNPTQRAMEVQTLVETASSFGQGRIWLVVTAHGDVQALKENVQQEIYAKINQRFDIQCKLSNEDIDKVVRERLLRKTQTATSALRTRFQERSGEITDLGTLQGTRRVYRVPKEEDFADFYPYLPWMIDVIPNIVKGIAQSANRNEALTGSNRTMIGVVQGGIIETKDLLQRPVGTLLSLADLYDQLSSDAPVETRTDILRVRDRVDGASEYTELVARALYLLGQDEYIPCTLENITRAMVNTLDANLASERTKVKTELERLVTHGYVKQVGDNYVFLSTQQRTFQDKVRQREEDYYRKNYDLSLKLKDYEKADMLRFDNVPVKGQPGRNKSLRIVLDGRVIYNPNEQVTVQVYSPMQYYLDQDLSDDSRLRLRSNQEPNSFFFRMGESKALRQALARAVATREVADEVLSSGAGNRHEKEVAQLAKERDLLVHQDNVRYELTRAVQDGKLFLRGTSYDLMDGGSASEAVRNTLSYFLFTTIYTRYNELPHRIVNEVNAVKAALNDNTANADLMALGVYKADGTLNETNVLVSTLKGLLPQAEDDRGTTSAQDLLQKIEQPPYGWDGNAVKVGLALLLRVSQCRLSENSAYLTDPHSPEVLEALTKAMRFKSLRVQGVRSELKSQELTQARGFMRTVFNVQTSVVPTSLNNELGSQLKALNEQAHTLQDWSKTINCPLPQAFSAGQDLVAEMLNIAAYGVRIPYFMRSWETVKQYKELLQDLASFKSEHGQRYIEMRDFFNRMTNADEVPGAVRSFLSDWRAVRQDNAFTESARWQDLLTTYSTALVARDVQMEQWIQETHRGLAEIAANLPAQAAQAGIPPEHVEAEVAVLLASLQPLQSELEQPNLGYGETRRLHKAYLAARMNMPTRLREVATRYQPIVSPPIPQSTISSPGTPTANPQEVHISWQSMEQTRLASPTDLDHFLEKLRAYVTNELTKGNVVILE